MQLLTTRELTVPSWEATFWSSMTTRQSSGVKSAHRCWTWARSLEISYRRSCHTVCVERRRFVPVTKREGDDRRLSCWRPHRFIL